MHSARRVRFRYLLRESGGMSGKGEESRVNANYERFPAQIRIKGH